MSTYHKVIDHNQVVSNRSSGRFDRRRFVQIAGGTGLSFGAAGVLIASASRASGPDLSINAHSAHQEGTPAAEAPQLGEQADGTHLWRVRVGGMDMESQVDAHAFLPGEITINAGDTIWFAFSEMPGAHTVTFTSGADVPPLQFPDPDAATPASGPPTLIFNNDVMFPVGGNSYDGTGYINSGVDFLRDPSMPPYMLTFTQPGTYEYTCVFHFMVMNGKVIVQEAGAELPYDQAGYDELADEQYTALIEAGKATTEQYVEAIATEREDGTTLWEASVGAGEEQARVMRFLPDTMEIQVGDTIRWVNRSPGEPHTVTFLGGEAPPEDISVEMQADGMPKFIQSNVTLLPQGDSSFDGVGLRNSGFMFPPVIGSDTYELTFTAPGEYLGYCILHSGPDGSGMATTITVTEQE